MLCRVVGPRGGDHGACAVRQNRVGVENPTSVDPRQGRERLPVKRMARAENRYLFGVVAVVGSVSSVRSTKFRITSCYSVWPAGWWTATCLGL